MAPTRATSPPKKAQSPLRQSTLPFKTRKAGIAPPKAKAKARATVNPKKRRRDESESESEVESNVVVAQNSDSENDDEMSVSPAKKAELDMQDEAGLYRKYYRKVQKKMGRMSPIHNQGQTKIHDMLRVFDNTYEYGPCVGLTRLQRWERAEAMGLNPPPEVREILLTRQGGEDSSLVHNVFHGLV